MHCESHSLFFIRITFCTQFVLFTRCEVENDNCGEWLQNNWLFFRKQLLQLDLTEASKTNPYVQFSLFSNDRLSVICLNEDPHMDQSSCFALFGARQYGVTTRENSDEKYPRTLISCPDPELLNTHRITPYHVPSGGQKSKRQVDVSQRK